MYWEITQDTQNTQDKCLEAFILLLNAQHLLQYVSRVLTRSNNSRSDFVRLIFCYFIFSNLVPNTCSVLQPEALSDLQTQASSFVPVSSVAGFLALSHERCDLFNDLRNWTFTLHVCNMCVSIGTGDWNKEQHVLLCFILLVLIFYGRLWWKQSGQSTQISHFTPLLSVTEPGPQPDCQNDSLSHSN